MQENIGNNKIPCCDVNKIGHSATPLLLPSSVSKGNSQEELSVNEAI